MQMTLIGIIHGLPLMGLLNFLMCPNRLVTHAAAALLWTVCDNFGFRVFLKWKVLCFWVLSMQVILINGQFPGPRLDVVTNDNIILNLFNKLDQPFLLTWCVVFLSSLHFLNESSLGLTTTLYPFFHFFTCSTLEA